ncbi:methylated-DNA--[protein]-cysteine S-methyltransferase [Alkalibacterium iburiense]|uniref:Methylated-DNA--protein-cysteine methyltransferase n=1 Tax=Alkalibacterium iburiense TaxID=290589 RepID=A0ABP3H814_9LACT
MSYNSPLGKLLLVANDHSLIGLWYEKQMYKEKMMPKEMKETDNHPILKTATYWLDDYFAGEKSDSSNLPLNPEGGSFRKLVWSIISEIPYGKVQTYGEIAKEVAKRLGKETMSAQAVGGAVGHNPLCIIIPCHRVVGSNGSLTGYSGGIDKKIILLEHEGVELSKYIIPQTGTRK